MEARQIENFIEKKESLDPIILECVNKIIEQLGCVNEKGYCERGVTCIGCIKTEFKGLFNLLA